MQPLKFKPYLKRVIWGGSELPRFKGCDSDLTDIGESWEISAVPGHESVVIEGEFSGLSITELICRFKAELVGRKVYEQFGNRFPLLIKFLCARQDLSLQVHPDDKLAMSRHNSPGKSEMWYIVEAEPGAKIYSGLSRSITPEQFDTMSANHTLLQAVTCHTSHPGDSFYLPAGRLHALGAGNLVVEVQQSSDITYRVDDYERRDSNGNLRELHTELAKEAIDYAVEPSYRLRHYGDDVVSAKLIECKYFVVRREKVRGRRLIVNAHDSFLALVCIEGDGTLTVDGQATQIRKGETVLVPASQRRIHATGSCTLITVAVP